MPNWLIEPLIVLTVSKRTQWAFIVGIFLYILIPVIGDHVINAVEFFGPIQCLVRSAD